MIKIIDRVIKNIEARLFVKRLKKSGLNDKAVEILADAIRKTITGASKENETINDR